MKVLFLPDGTKGNPYQINLKKSLKRKGVEVEIKNGKGIFKILNAIKEWRPNILHFHWLYVYIISFKRNIILTFIKGIVFLMQIIYIRYFKKIKIVWTVHNLLNHERIHWVWEFLIKFISLRFFDGYVVHCEKAKSLFIKKYRISKKRSFKVYVIPHGNYIGCYPNNISRLEARKKLCLDVEDFVFLYLGSLRKYKGTIKLIKCFKYIRKKDTKLVIAGNPYNREINKRIRKEIESVKEILYFPGFVKVEDMQFFYNSADVVVLPFKNILTSGSVICAMGFKKPLILPRIGCLEEIPQNNFFYNPEDKEGLKKCMEEVYEKREGLHEIGEENYLWVRKLDLDLIADKHLHIFNLK